MIVKRRPFDYAAGSCAAISGILVFFLISKAGIQFCADLCLVKVLTDDAELDHSVTHSLVPFFLDLWICFKDFLLFLCRTCGNPLSAVACGNLAS